MGKVTFTIDRRTTKKDGTSPIRLSIGNGTKIYVSAGVSVPADQFIGGRVNASYKGAKSLNARLERMAVSADARIMQIKDAGLWRRFTQDPKLLKAAIADPGQSLQDIIAPPVLFSDVAKAFNSTHTGRTVEIYANTFAVMDKYLGGGFDALRMDEITPKWLSGFEVWCSSSRENSMNTVSIHLRNIRAVFNYALDNDMAVGYPFRKYRIKRERTRKRALSLQDVRELMALDLSGPLAEYRDTFILLIYLIGVNVADLWAGDTIIRDGRLEYRRAKTHKDYSIKLEPEALELLDRLGYGERHILATMDRYANVHNYTRKLNKGLKRLGPIIGKQGNGTPKTRPLFPDLTTYWSRHTWATLSANELDTPKETISAALGHEIGSPITSIYIDFDQTKVDQANRKLIDLIKG